MYTDPIKITSLRHDYRALKPGSGLPLIQRARSQYGTRGQAFLPKNLKTDVPPVDTTVSAIYNNTGQYLGYIEGGEEEAKKIGRAHV